MSELVVDGRLWGKERGLARRYPLICHLLDTAAVAGVLWDRVLTDAARARLAGAMGLSEGQFRRLVSMWAGLHDVGKIIPAFQAMSQDAYAGLKSDVGYAHAAGVEEQGFGHDKATQWALTSLFEAWGYPVSRSVRRSAHHQVAQLLGGHHGCVHRGLEPRHLRNREAYVPELGGPGWEAQRVAHAEAVRRLVGADQEDVVRGPLPAQVAVTVLGLVVVADWLASQEAVITPRLPVEGWAADDAGLAAHWSEAVGGAGGWVAEAGLGVAEWPAKHFGEQFSFAGANALQASVAEGLPRLVDGPGLLLVTAPTGEGKTEAALHAASVMGRVSGASGLFFALPTMATADAMHGRVSEFAERNVAGDRALTLLHSMAWLSGAYAQSGTEEAAGELVGDMQSALVAGRWLRGAKRGLLAPLATGTIDQALAGVLPVRYNVLRLLGLSNKVLVVDEAHAYGPWMHSLLVRLLEWLGECGAPVVLLSATLSGRSASSLVDAYRRGCGFGQPAEVVPVYPGWLYVSGRSGAVSAPCVVGTARARDIEVRTVSVSTDAPAGSAAGRAAAVVEELRPLVQRGGCALVCCATVAEAQETYRLLRSEFPQLAVAEDGLLLLHSRFPAARRLEITEACERAFGKPGVEGRRRPPVSVLVATQVVEQSLDLDFDVVVSDLAPLAQLLQRAGRCMRHDRAGLTPEEGGRAGWVGMAPRLTVLEPVDVQGRVRAPKRWGAVYPEALLTRTSHLLRERVGKSIAVPGDVQELVDAVYAEDFGDRLESAVDRERLERQDAERVGAVLAEESLAQMTLVNPPMGMVDLAELSRDGALVDEALLTTRLGADSERAVCVFVQSGGAVTLDPGGTSPVPGWGEVGRISVAQARVVMRQTVPVPGGWLRGRGMAQEVPVSWGRLAALREMCVLPMRRSGRGLWACTVGDRSISFTSEGLETSTS
ncbi:CRISPR-associated helicase Cas3' [Streptomyces sioyaensis]|uniref:CRISPR-associated helicase Cas3' n=1 Tax=Streptomyces sioyaensis TaxID=67364 RepID=UPI00228660EF|nr:CRISPR-associated helicase Cas3' [Streptomyces sioyaensis]MCF3174858.1 CRISPR-associated helicase Cas3' [Streptomyces sioyaensis]